MGGSKYPRSKVDLGGGRGWLTKEAAASIFRIDRAIGHRLQITEAGRSFFQQDEHWQKYSDEAQKFVSLMVEHGWIRTVYRWVGGVWTLVERWHFEYFQSRDKHRFDPVPAAGGKSAPAIPEEEFMDMLYFYCEELDTAYVVHPWTGKKRALPSAEYEAALEAGKKFKRGVSKAKANKIPNA